MFVQSMCRKSAVNVIDAKNMSSDPVAVVELPHRVPYGFHAFFVTEVSKVFQLLNMISASKCYRSLTSFLFHIACSPLLITSAFGSPRNISMDCGRKKVKKSCLDPSISNIQSVISYVLVE